MRFSESFLRSLKDRASIVGYAERLVQWDRRKSQPARGDYWAPCPFHGEKTASFHVREQLGAYKCFGCGEAGGVIDLAMKLEGLSFPEAVERVANFAGIPLPVDDAPADDAEERRRKRLFVVVERAQDLFVQALDAPEGREAKAYLERRGLNAQARAQFGVGYASGGYTWAIEKLRAEGVALEELVEAGLAYAGDNGRRPTDVFRNRVMFPIADPQGRVIAFGGRALEPDAKAKYLNSPETALFHKGRTLYRLKEARALAAKTKVRGVLVAEGYMDVIAFERAGIAAVAPLGTALTEDQLALVWRVAGEPVFCFDGDEAGQRAAARAIELALPQLGPDRTFRVALLPPGQDPDDVFRTEGPKALAALVEQARPAIEALFDRERARTPLDTPEAKSGLRKRLRECAGRIADPETARLYREDLMARADALLARPRPEQQVSGRRAGPPRRGERWTPAITATPELRPLAAPGQRRRNLDGLVREVLDAPELLDRHMELFAALPLADPTLKIIRDEILGLFIQHGSVDRAALSLHLSHRGDVRAVARLSHWPDGRTSVTHNGVRSMRDPKAVEAEWVLAAERETAAPALRDEMAAFRADSDLDKDADAFARAVKVLEDGFDADGRRRRQDEEAANDEAENNAADREDERDEGAA
jgi:DNA primase